MLIKGPKGPSRLVGEDVRTSLKATVLRKFVSSPWVTAFLRCLSFFFFAFDDEGEIMMNLHKSAGKPAKQKAHMQITSQMQTKQFVFLLIYEPNLDLWGVWCVEVSWALWTFPVPHLSPYFCYCLFMSGVFSVLLQLIQSQPLRFPSHLSHNPSSQLFWPNFCQFSRYAVCLWWPLWVVCSVFEEAKRAQWTVFWSCLWMFI